MAAKLKTPEAEAESGASCSELSEGDGDSENSSGSGGSAASLTHRWTSFFPKEKRRAKRLQRQEDQEKAERDEEEQAAKRRRWETEADERKQADKARAAALGPTPGEQARWKPLETLFPGLAEEDKFAALGDSACQAHKTPSITAWWWSTRPANSEISRRGTRDCCE